MTEYPITPPPELVGEWLCQDSYPWDPDLQATITITTGRLRNVAIQAARWGADQELEACVEWIPKYTPWDGDQLRNARRPMPPSLKQQALALIDGCTDPHGDHLDDAALDTIRRSLESLPD